MLLKAHNCVFIVYTSKVKGELGEEQIIGLYVRLWT